MTESFTKADFLTAHKYAQKYNVARDKVLKKMKQLAGVNMPGTQIPYVIRNRKSHRSTSDYIHPRAELAFLKLITDNSNEGK
ncbi:MAG: hypothetical protein J6Q44_01955 [Alphaproteobacteria bacterium]|nr:hypothetical protein [Alphaproteobacteria bacterium]